jgi:hypothetical protein
MRLVAAVIVFQALSAFAAENYVVHGAALSRVSECRGVSWYAGAILHNRNAAPVRVQLTGGSAGAFVAPVEVEIPANGVHVAQRGGLAGNASDRVLWVTRLDVPDGVEIEGRLDLYETDLCTLRPPISVAEAKLVLPSFDRLADAGEIQTHNGADLGMTPVRLNVAVYNAGTASANVIVRARRPLCAQPTSVVHTATVPANTITQVTLPPVPQCNTGDETNPTWSTEVRVEADQPSFSFVSVIATTPSPTVFATVVR